MNFLAEKVQCVDKQQTEPLDSELKNAPKGEPETNFKATGKRNSTFLTVESQLRKKQKLNGRPAALDSSTNPTTKVKQKICILSQPSDQDEAKALSNLPPNRKTVKYESLKIFDPKTQHFL